MRKSPPPEEAASQPQERPPSPFQSLVDKIPPPAPEARIGGPEMFGSAPKTSILPWPQLWCTPSRQTPPLNDFIDQEVCATHGANAADPVAAFLRSVKLQTRYGGTQGASARR